MTTHHNPRPNLRRIARQLGVSAMTVYRVINHAPSVREETRKRVLEALNWHGYFVNKRKGIDAIVFDVISGNAYFEKLASTMIDNLERNNPGTRCFRTDHRLRPEEYFNRVAQSDLAVFCSLPESELVEQTRATNPEIYTISLSTENSSDVVITADNIRGGELAAQHLHKLGHSHVAVFLDEMHPNRYIRYKSFFSEFHLLNPHCRIDIIERRGLELPGAVCRAYFARSAPPPSAIFFLVGFHAQRFYRDVVLPEPERFRDLSILSYDRNEDLFTDHPEEVREFDRIEFHPQDMIDWALYYICNRPLMQKASRIRINTHARLQTAGSVKNRID